MITMKFQPIRDSRHENHNIEDYNLLSFDFDGIKKEVYDNVNLSIFVDDYCNADCKFCVAQLRFENTGKVYRKTKIENDSEFFERLNYVLEKVKPLNPSISITGGEPTKSKRLPEVLRLISKHNLRKRTFTTNGSGLLDIVEGKTVIQHLIDNGFQHLNISRAHYIEEKNKEIMKYQSGYCSNEMLETIVSYSKANNLRPRMSCLLLKEGIYDITEMIKYMDFYKSIGLDNIIFRELMDFDKENMNNLIKKEYCEINKVKLDDIWKNIDKDSRFTPIKNIVGYYYYVEVYKYDNIDMCSESANLVKIYKEKERNKDVVYELIFHSNGNLNGSWEDDEDILLKYNNL